jgi:phage-related tail protein
MIDIYSFHKIGITVKELEELIEKQKKLLTQLKQECKMLNEQLEVIAIKYKYYTSRFF